MTLRGNYISTDISYWLEAKRHLDFSQINLQDLDLKQEPMVVLDLSAP
jgi:hypothetical protein